MCAVPSCMQTLVEKLYVISSICITIYIGAAMQDWPTVYMHNTSCAFDLMILVLYIAL